MEWAPQPPASSRPNFQSRMALLTGVWTAIGVAIYVVAPLTAPALLGLAVIAPLAWCWMEGRLPWRTPSAVVAGLAVAGAYILINASWSLSPAEAYTTVAVLFAGIGVLHVTATGLSNTPAPALRAMALGLLAGMAVGAAVLCLELLSDQWLRRLLATYYLGLRPDGRHMQVEAGRVTLLQPYLLNRSMAALGLTFWPALLVLERLAMSSRQRGLLLSGLLLTPVAILVSQHGTSKMAFAGAAATYGVGRLSPLLAKRLLIAGWLAATLLVAPIATLAYSNHLHLVRWLDNSVRHRIVIWGYTKNEIAKAPMLGAGISTSRALHSTDLEGVPREPGTDFPLALALHSHNGYLQVWHEAGAVGAVLLFVLGLLILRAIAAKPPALQPHFYAMFAACALVAASSYSIWAPWFMSALVLTPVFAGIGAALLARGEKEAFS